MRMKDHSERHNSTETRVGRVVGDIEELILSGKYKPYDKLPSENDLAETYGVSRPTVRVALKELQARQYIFTRQGAGSFVKEVPKITAGLENLESISDSIRATGRNPGMNYASQTIRPLLPEEAELLNLSPEVSILELRRTFLSDNQVIAYSYDMIPIDIFPEPDNIPKLSGSLFAYFINKLNVSPAYAKAEINAVHSRHVGWGPEAQQHNLFVLLTQKHYDTEDRIILYSKTYFIESRYSFTLNRVRR